MKDTSENIAEDEIFTETEAEKCTNPSKNQDTIDSSPQHIFECSHCGETYDIKQDLVNHLLSNHSNERNHKIQETVPTDGDKEALSNTSNQNDGKAVEVISISKGLYLK